MNKYDDLVRVAQSLQHTEIFEREEPPTGEEAAEFLRANEAHLVAARETLTQECHVDVVYSEEYIEKHLEEIDSLRTLALSMQLHLAEAEREGRLGDALKSGVNGLDLTLAMRRGGLIVDMLMAVAVSGIFIEALRRIRHRFGLDELRLLSTELQRVESQRESFVDIAARDEEWERRFPSDEEFDPSNMEWPESDGEEDELDEEAKQAIADLVAHYANMPEEERRHTHGDIDNRDLAGIRLLAVESAVRVYQLTHDMLPDSLDQLSPTPFVEVPRDPYTDEPFHYRIDGDDFALCSVDSSNG